MSKDIYKDDKEIGYWQDVENKILDPKVLANEFAEDEFDSFSVKKTRRNFLKIMGFSVTALPLTGCIKIPVRKAVPYLYKNDVVIPGVANWYATTFGGYPLLAKTREGRPIKIEGNKKSNVTKGGANAQMQAAVISLYDSYRYNAPIIEGKKLEWEAFDTEASKALLAAKEMNKEVILMTSPVSSPSELKLINEFSKKVKATVVVYDATENDGILRANNEMFGKRVYSEYDYEQADFILSFGADFLGSFGNDVSSTKQYVARRDPKHKRGMSKHVQVESLMSMTGMNADKRFTRSLQEQRNFILSIYSEITGKSVESIKLNDDDKKLVKEIASDLKSAGKNAVVVSDDKDYNIQLIVNKINDSLGAYGKTVFAKDKKFVLNSNNDEARQAFTRMNAGKVGAVLFLNVNPVYNFSDAKFVKSAISKVDMSLSFASSEDETSALCKFVAPTNHTFETWSDTQVDSKEFAITQPVIQPLFGSRMATESLMSFAGMKGSFYDYMKKNWDRTFYPKSKKDGEINFWNTSLHDGIVTLDGFSKNLSSKKVKLEQNIKNIQSISYPKFVVQTYIKSAIGNGEMANNPFLQEMPDPVTKATWDNYVMISPKYANEKGIKSGDMVNLKTKSHSVTIPAIVQPGTASNTFGVALGYGRTVAGKIAKNLGGNAYGFDLSEATLTKTGEFKGLAQTQTHHSMEGRDIIRETTYSEYKKDPKSGNYKKAKLVNIYPEHKKDGHQWAMAIDLAQCTGCSACIISCNTENNVPVVGRQEVANRREMHWLRIDRYYKGDENEPEVMNMPMLCQHCENAPCENVCPVLATVHSSDGINQQIYNRCVGTRYCANNCPYKVRRFNWFNYDRGDSMARLALNPDISQRSRGVMEKCSFCIQRIQEGKLQAKKERRALKDGDIQVACQQSCPGDGIVFGDMNDPSSKISEFLGSERNYTVLEELNVRPRVSYLTKVRNK